MILKVSHLVFSSNNFEDDCRRLPHFGYKNIFTDLNIENLEIKKPLFTNFNKLHDLSYFTLKNSLSIELLNWRTGNHRQSNFIPIFEGLDEKNLNSIKTKKIGNISLKQGNMKYFNIPICLLFKERFQLNKMLVKTSDILKSISFWKNLGFVLLEQNDDFAVLQLSSVLPGFYPFNLYLEKANDINLEPCLDDNGISCISLLSSSVEQEKIKLSRQAIEIFEVGELLINQKLLNIIFIRGPCGELVEIIDLRAPI